MDKHPRLSIIMPVYNGEKYLAEALDSIPHGSLWTLEIIVVDDGSMDRTPELVRESGRGCRCLRQQNAGPAAARNTGLLLAKGSIIGFLDADDLWPEDKLPAQMAFLDAHPEVDAVMGTVQWLRRAPEAEEFSAVGDPIPGAQLGCGLFRRRIFDRVGLFDATLRYSEDVDWLMRAREKGARIGTLDQAGLYYRYHEASMTYGRPTASLGLLQVFKRSLDRRRSRADE